MLTHFLSLIPRKRQAQMRGQRPNRIDQRILHIYGEPPAFQIDEHDESSLSLNERTDRGPGLLAQYQITLPVAGDSAVFDLCWAIADEYHILELSHAWHASMGTTLRPPRTEAARELLTERSTSLHEEGLIDRLV